MNTLILLARQIKKEIGDAVLPLRLPHGFFLQFDSKIRLALENDI